MADIFGAPSSDPIVLMNPAALLGGFGAPFDATAPAAGAIRDPEAAAEPGLPAPIPKTDQVASPEKRRSRMLMIALAILGLVVLGPLLFSGKRK